MRGKPQLDKLTKAMETTPPSCADDPRFIADRFTDTETTTLRRVCRSCPLITLCADYARLGLVDAGFWAGKDRTPRPGRPRLLEEAS